MYGQLTVIQQTLLLGCCRQILLLAVNCDGDRWTGGSSVSTYCQNVLSELFRPGENSEENGGRKQPPEVFYQKR